MYGATGCGSAHADLKVKVTNVAPPVAPAPKTIIADTNIIYTVSFDSILVGTGGSEIEWATNDSFANYHTINPYGTISINLAPGMDTIIWLRSNKKSTGEKSTAVNTRARVLYPLLSAGLLDKTHWKIVNNLSDDFEYSNNAATFYPYTLPIALRDAFNNKWSLNNCWGENCNPDICGNHFNGSEISYFNHGYVNGNPGTNGAGNEVSFSNGMVHLQATQLPSAYTASCRSTEPFYYKAGMLVSKNRVDLTKPGILEVRCKTPGNVGAYPSFWTFPNIEFDIMEDNIDVPELAQRMTSNIHDWSNNNVSCQGIFWKQTPCGYTQDWHTYSVVFSNTRIIFFVDGKETWSVDRSAQPGTKFPLDNAYTVTRIILALGVTINNQFGDQTYQMPIDYVRYYQPADGTDNLPESLQNVVGGVAKTLESPNANGQTLNDKALYISNANNNNHRTHSITTGNITFTNQPWLQKIYYMSGNRCYNSYYENGAWYEYPLVSWINDVAGCITEDGDRIYYLSTGGEIKYFQWVTNHWQPGRTYAFTRSYTNGSSTVLRNNFTVDKLGRVWYIGQDKNIYAWCPVSATQGQTVQITNTTDALWGLTMHSCGCLLFYQGTGPSLYQQTWWNVWRPKQVITNYHAESSLVLDEANSIVYFTDFDYDLHAYKWDYNAINPAGLKKLGGNVCTAYDNAVNQDPWFEYPKTIALSPDRNSIYYWEEHNKIWYYYNDFDHGIPASGNPIKANWYRTPVHYGEVGWGSVAFEPEGQKRLFYTGGDNTVHYVEWVNADNPRDCFNGGAWGTFDSYKTDESGNNPYPPNQTQKPQDASQKANNDKINSFAFPNPSNEKFTIIVTGLSEDATGAIQISGTDGKCIL